LTACRAANAISLTPMPESPSEHLKNKTVTRRLRLVSLLVFTAFLVHFSFTLVYVLPDVGVPAPLRHYSYRYIRPLFHQGWKLFAPEVPRCSGALYVRVLAVPNAPAMKLSSFEGLPMHRKLRYVDDKIALYVMNALEVDCDDARTDTLVVECAHRTIRSAVHYAARRVERHTGSLPETVQLTLVIDRIPPFGGETNGSTRVIAIEPVTLTANDD